MGLGLGEGVVDCLWDSCVGIADFEGIWTSIEDAGVLENAGDDTDGVGDGLLQSRGCLSSQRSFTRLYPVGH